MARMTFRFTTECEMTLEGANEEELYLQFKDFMHQQMDPRQAAALTVFPPESVQLFFRRGDEAELHEIPDFRGDYQKDIVAHQH